MTDSTDEENKSQRSVIGACNDGDETPSLSAHALAALQEFYEEQEDFSTSSRVSEDWNLSQFWYDDWTAGNLAKEALRAAHDVGHIACVSTPTVFEKLIELAPHCDAKLFEYDRRFQKFAPRYIFYDYNMPVDIPDVCRNKFDVILADPPHLSDECISKLGQTIIHIAKPSCKILLCTGAILTSTVASEFGLHVSNFRPRHSSNLQNEFRCFVNYEDSLP